MTEWERVNADTERLAVPGGWLYRVRDNEDDPIALAVVFVPDTGHADAVPEQPGFLDPEAVALDLGDDDLPF